MTDGFFHADPHPGNVLIRDGKIVWIDMGMMGRLSEHDRSSIRLAIEGVAEGDNGKIEDAVLAIGKFSGKPDKRKLHDGIEGLMRTYGSMGLGEIDIAKFFTDLLEVMKDCGTMALYTAAYHLSEGAAVDVTPILLELVGRGEESVAERIEDPAVLQKLCEKGNKWAAYTLYDKYRWGDEEHGIFIDKERAKEYYDLAGDIPYKEEWDPTDEAGEEYPTTREYVLTGDSDTLDGIETLIRDLSQRFGIPENEEDGLGLFVPQQQLIKLLVGSDSVYYRGNVQYLERKAPDRLVITTEADKGKPLLYALRQCFGNLNIEMKDAE